MHALGLGNSHKVMESLVQPPEAVSVRKALENLVTIGAVSVSQNKKESLTPLGKHLANLPVDARIGEDHQILLFACMITRIWLVCHIYCLLFDTSKLITKQFADRGMILL